MKWPTFKVGLWISPGHSWSQLVEYASPKKNDIIQIHIRIILLLPFNTILYDSYISVENEFQLISTIIDSTLNTGWKRPFF